MFYVVLLVAGFVLLPCVSFLCRLLNLDKFDSHIMFLVSMPIVAFVLVLGLWGLFYRVY